MLNNSEVENEGFLPLKKTQTTPVSLSQSKLDRAMSFNAKTGEKEDLKAIWESSNWARVEKSRGFGSIARANSFVGSNLSRSQSFRSPLQREEVGAICVVDPFSTGAYLAAEVNKNGLKCVRIFSIWDSPVACLVQDGVGAEFCATLQYDDSLEDEDRATNDVVDAIRALPFPVLAVIPGAETGVELADRLSARLGLRTNGEEGSLARRNKYHMGEKVRASGVRAVKQALCNTIDELHAFLIDLGGGVKRETLRCVVKPVQSAGTDDVFLCATFQEAEVAFKRILGKRNGIGLINENVLAQEFLQGKEYVVDKISRNGVHKVVAIWEYDKRRCNGANFVYFGMRLMASNTEKSQQLVRYADGVLNALGIMNGPSHMEVMYCDAIEGIPGSAGPCLVEVGSRCHGGEGSWLSVAKECIGYTIVEATVDCYLTGQLFEQLNKDNFPKLKAGREVDMVCRQAGVVRGFPGDAVIRKLPSYRSINWELKAGDHAAVTIDCFTRPGSVQLVNETEEQAEIDLEAIHSLEELGLLDYLVVCPNAPPMGAIVVVDPFGIGASLAALAVKWGYKLILVFSDSVGKDSTTIVHQGTKLAPMLLVHHDGGARDQNAALQSSVDSLIKESAANNSTILAILPGTSLGSELAERLAIKFGTRRNAESSVLIRHNQYEAVKKLSKSHLNSVKQRKCRSLQEVHEFISSLPSTTKEIVLKPISSLCSETAHIVSLGGHGETVRHAFESIYGQTDPTGATSNCVVVQEIIYGEEFLIDGVSRDGVFKVTAVWAVDYSSSSHANRFPSGMRLLSPLGNPTVSNLIRYVKSILPALSVVNGPSHCKLIVSPLYDGASLRYEPYLISFGAYCHQPSPANSSNQSWPACVHTCIGYSQLDVLLQAYVRPDQFDDVPLVYSLKKEARLVFLHNHNEGKCVDMPGLATIRSLSSFSQVDLVAQLGSYIPVTTDQYSSAGTVVLTNISADDLDADYQVIRELEAHGELFTVI